ncbi:hypothetical protein GCM10028803_21000 [Larkinella knui]|uniref:Uncharacterized protein n=1 Tax=Larkinella knui TaxID=2025310 RepID=A0A3P1CV56_9BACT|nr:hypothetical protein [Larkinella knui]RRB17185.1 hypothetical protein EHT87_02575 [Larkinella knui]
MTQKKEYAYQLNNQDTTIILQTVIDTYKPRWAEGFKGQPMRILPNKYIKPGTSIIINYRKVAYSEVDSSKIDSVFSIPKFFATIEEFRTPMDSSAYVDISFRDIGDEGKFWLIRKPGKGWIIIKKQFYKI